MKPGFLILLFCVIALVVNGQNHLVRSYSYENGLNTYNIFKVVTDENGFLWIATQSGLFRFDGIEFEHFSTSSKELRIPGNFISDLEIIGQFLVAAIYNAGIVVINTRTLERMDFGVNVLTEFGRKVFAVNVNEAVFIGSEKGVSRINFNHGGLRIDHCKETHLDILQDKIVSSDSSIWLLKDHKEVFLLRNNLQGITVLDSMTFNRELSDIEINRDQVLVLHGSGIQSLTCSKNKILKGKRLNILTTQTQKLEKIISRGNQRVLLTRNFCYFLDSEFRILSRQNYNLNSGFIQGASFDQLGNIWVSTSKSLEFVSGQQSPFRAFSNDPTNRIRLEHIYTLTPESPTKIFVC